MARLILASSSPYRRALLARLGLGFETRAPGVPERACAGESAGALAQRLAATKAAAITESDAVVIGADQVAALGTELLRKPGDHSSALEQLLACQGKTAVFHTAVTVIDHRSSRRWHGLDHTTVRFARLSEAQLDRYLKLEQPYDCAGGFKAEGLGIALLEAVMTEDPTALLGLPLIWLTGVLREVGLDPLDPPRQ